MAKKLTTRQKLFIAALPTVNWVGSEAVKAAKYRVSNDQRAAEIAYQLLQKTPVREAVERLREARLKKLGIHHERILRNRVRVAEADARKFFNEDGTVKPPQEWDDEMAACVAGFEVIELYEGKGDEKKGTGYLKKVRFNDRNPAQHDLMDHAGLFPQKSVKVDVDVKEVQITNVGLSAKIFYLINVALEKEKELEGKAAAPKPKGKVNKV